MTIVNIKKILYASSLSDYSRHVYEYAIQLALKNDAEIVMMHAIEPVSELGRFIISQYLPDELINQVKLETNQNLLNEMQRRIDEYHEEEIRRIAPDKHVHVKTLIAYGEHGDAILEVARQEDADVIVMGTEYRGNSKNKSQTTQHVIKNSRVPVLVIPVESR